LLITGDNRQRTWMQNIDINAQYNITFSNPQINTDGFSNYYEYSVFESETLSLTSISSLSSTTSCTTTTDSEYASTPSSTYFSSSSSSSSSSVVSPVVENSPFPTFTPSFSPTRSPTLSPTRFPTFSPTISSSFDTFRPTVHPTLSPSIFPTSLSDDDNHYSLIENSPLSSSPTSFPTPPPALLSTLPPSVPPTLLNNSSTDASSPHSSSPLSLHLSRQSAYILTIVLCTLFLLPLLCYLLLLFYFAYFTQKYEENWLISRLRNRRRRRRFGPILRRIWGAHIKEYKQDREISSDKGGRGGGRRAEGVRKESSNIFTTSYRLEYVPNTRWATQNPDSKSIHKKEREKEARGEGGGEGGREGGEEGERKKISLDSLERVEEGRKDGGEGGGSEWERGWESGWERKRG
ncbi:MAG: hypothetical protein O7C56_07425, partial [Rickettsia endosymbiont of Ixodes persulcatus]|nr:hypothetical protein [Rickettsia endosymbiont of Ixodes persulcatus]